MYVSYKINNLNFCIIYFPTFVVSQVAALRRFFYYFFPDAEA